MLKAEKVFFAIASWNSCACVRCAGLMSELPTQQATPSIFPNFSAVLSRMLLTYTWLHLVSLTSLSPSEAHMRKALKARKGLHKGDATHGCLVLSVSRHEFG